MIPYEVIEHTAEIGIRAYGRTREELFAHMAQGMFGLIVPPEEIQSRTAMQVAASSSGWEELLVAWLRELVFLFDTKHILVKTVQIRRSEPTKIEATVSGEELDPERHHVDKEVKAVTYCDLAFSRQPDGLWMAQVIFDI